MLLDIDVLQKNETAFIFTLIVDLSRYLFMFFELKLSYILFQLLFYNKGLKM